LVFIYAVSIGEVLQSSLGYFLTPLVNVLLGYLFFQERLTRVQILSLICAVIGVGILAASLRGFPWIALTLAGSFGTYGLIRKRTKIDSLIGLAVETALLAPIAGGYLLILGSEGVGAFGFQSISLDSYLILSGVVTAIPLILFVGAAKRLRLSTLGFLQFLTPTMHFLLAVLLFGEDFNLPHVICFTLIWLGLIIYTVDAFRRHGKVRRLSENGARSENHDV
jgi:chloramphenicol-sensitive protein RarD